MSNMTHCSLTADVETAHTWFDDVGDSAETHEYKEKAEPIKVWSAHS